MSTAKHPNLEGTFAPSPRGKGLDGILGARPRPTTTVATSAEPAAKPTPDPEPRPMATERPKQRAAINPGETDKILNVAIYLPPATLEAAREWTRAHEATYTDLMGQGYDKVGLEQLIEAFRPEVAAEGSGMPRRAVKARGAGGIQRQLRMTSSQRDWLDAQVQATGAGSRSALVAKVYELFLHVPT